MARSRAFAIVLMLVLALTFGAGCSDETVPPDAPDGHTVVKDGVAHAPGLNNPNENCASCHGDTLEGGTSGEPSCFLCHGRKW